MKEYGFKIEYFNLFQNLCYIIILSEKFIFPFLFHFLPRSLKSMQSSHSIVCHNNESIASPTLYNFISQEKVVFGKAEVSFRLGKVAIDHDLDLHTHQRMEGEVALAR